MGWRHKPTCLSRALKIWKFTVNLPKLYRVYFKERSRGFLASTFAIERGINIFFKIFIFHFSLIKIYDHIIKCIHLGLGGTIAGYP